MLFAMFQPCGAPSKKYLFSSLLGYQSGCQRRVLKKTPPKYVLGCSDSQLGASGVIFGSPLGPPFGAKFGQNEVWECMPSPLVSRGGSKTAPRWPEAPKLRQNGTQSRYQTLVPSSSLQDFVGGCFHWSIWA